MGSPPLRGVFRIPPWEIGVWKDDSPEPSPNLPATKWINKEGTCVSTVGPILDAEFVSSHDVAVTADNLRFRDPGTFREGEIHNHVSEWERIAGSSVEHQRVMGWIRNKVDVTEFVVPFKDTLKEVPRMVTKGSFLTSVDDKSGYDHLLVTDAIISGMPAAKLFAREAHRAIAHAQRRQELIQITGKLREEIEEWRFLDNWEGCMQWRE
ncbi:hypothetical protein Bbelb_281720 [Branchiostoma belcheri]|nr:hypothetical protein Bbelb_281720 [Branchiostoma belcheri]